MRERGKGDVEIPKYTLQQPDWLPRAHGSADLGTSVLPMA
jgi:hypothetical protein